jgi:glycosyltransferase involved in cell wall biosynthesis
MIDHFSTFPYGGAGQAARKLHEWMLRRDVLSRFNYWENSEVHPDDISFQPMEFYRPKGLPILNFFTRQLERYRRRYICKLYDRHVADRPGTHELFTIPWTLHPGRFDFDRLGSDVVHLHWIPFFIDYTRFFASIPQGTPIVWTLYDMNPLTGGCHYSDRCSRFTDQCGNCPQVDRAGPRDVSWHALRAKTAALADHNLHIVSPSSWLLELARQSPVFPRSAQFHHIPQGIDEQIFKPFPRTFARQQLDLPLDKPLVAFGADQISNHRKGIHHLFAALKIIRQSVPDLECVVFGGGELNLLSPKLPPFHHFGYIRDPHRQALIYSAVDLFTLPSIEDNLPQTGIESLACGTPVVAFSTGGIPEVVVHNVTGLCAPVRDEKGLADLITTLLADESMRQTMGANGRKRVEEVFTAGKQIDAYLNLYHKIAGVPLPQAARVRQDASKAA